MPDHLLVPATRADISSALSYALRYSRGGKRTHDRAALMADAAAEHLVEALHRAGFVIMKGPPAPAHEGSKPDHAMEYGTGDGS